MMIATRRSLLALSLTTALGLALPAAGAFAADSAAYFPPAGEWARNWASSSRGEIG